MEYAILRSALDRVERTAPYNAHSKAVGEMLDAVRVVLDTQAQQLADLSRELDTLRAQVATLTPPADA